MTCQPLGGLHRTPTLEGFWKYDLVRHASWNDAADPLAFGTHRQRSLDWILLCCSSVDPGISFDQYCPETH